MQKYEITLPPELEAFVQEQLAGGAWGSADTLFAYSMAVVQLAFGDKDEAVRLLEKSYEDHAPFDSADLGWILVDHRLDSLRSDPRFKKLTTRIFSGEPR